MLRWLRWQVTLCQLQVPAFVLDPAGLALKKTDPENGGSAGCERIWLVEKRILLRGKLLESGGQLLLSFRGQEVLSALADKAAKMEETRYVRMTFSIGLVIA